MEAALAVLVTFVALVTLSFFVFLGTLAGGQYNDGRFRFHASVAILTALEGRSQAEYDAVSETVRRDLASFVHRLQEDSRGYVPAIRASSTVSAITSGGSPESMLEALQRARCRSTALQDAASTEIRRLVAAHDTKPLNELYRSVKSAYSMHQVRLAGQGLRDWGPALARAVVARTADAFAAGPFIGVIVVLTLFVLLLPVDPPALGGALASTVLNAAIVGGFSIGVLNLLRDVLRSTRTTGRGDTSRARASLPLAASGTVLLLYLTSLAFGWQERWFRFSSEYLDSQPPETTLFRTFAVVVAVISCVLLVSGCRASLALLLSDASLELRLRKMADSLFMLPLVAALAASCLYFAVFPDQVAGGSQVRSSTPDASADAAARIALGFFACWAAAAGTALGAYALRVRGRMQRTRLLRRHGHRLARIPSPATPAIVTLLAWLMFSYGVPYAFPAFRSWSALEVEGGILEVGILLTILVGLPLSVVASVLALFWLRRQRRKQDHAMALLAGGGWVWILPGGTRRWRVEPRGRRFASDPPPEARQAAAGTRWAGRRGR